MYGPQAVRAEPAYLGTSCGALRLEVGKSPTEKFDPRPLYGVITLDFRGSRQRSVREGNDPKYIHFAFWTIHTRCSHTISRDHFYKNKNRQSHETPSSLQTAE
eukprot:scaffold97247_cov74-Phaeocystis_antarctica.AAC.1